MPIPEPNPTPAQIVRFAEIAMITVGEATALVASDSDQDISDAKWAATVEDIAAWPKFAYGKRALKKIDKIEYFEGDSDDARLGFRNTLRRRYGLPDLLTDESSSTEICYSTPTITADCCNR